MSANESWVYGEIDPIPMGNTYAPLNSMVKAKKFTILSGTASAQNHSFSTSARNTEFYAICSDPTAVVYLRRHFANDGQPAAAGVDGSCDAFLASGQKEQYGRWKATGFSYIVSSWTATIQVLSR